MSQRYQGRHVGPNTTASPVRRKAVVAAAASAGLVVPVVAAAATTETASAASSSTWDRLAGCESGGNWATNTGNSFYGGLQFTRSTWTGFGGGKYADRADHATRAQQIAIANKVLAAQGWGAWPACSSKLGLRGLPTTGGSTEAPVTAKKSTTVKSGTVAKAKAKAKARSIARAAAVAEARAAAKAKASASSRASAEAKAVARAEALATKVATSTVVTPKAATRRSSTAVRSTIATPALSGSVYVVKAGDTLGKIATAKKLSGGWKSLYAANSATVVDADLIYVGETLAIPKV